MTKRLLLLTAALFILAPAASAYGWSTAYTAMGGARVELHFTNVAPAANPGEATPVDPTINDQLKRLIAFSPAGSTIRGGIYNISEESGVIDKLKLAQARGVNIQLVQDLGDEPNLRGSSYLGTDDVHRCARSTGNSPCNGNAAGGIMHSKYMTFSKTLDGAGVVRTNVTWIGSHNQTVSSGGGAAAFNNSVTVYGDVDLYNGITNNVWTYMWNWATTGPTTSSPTWGNDFFNSPRGFVNSSISNDSLYASPEASTDLVAERLRNVTAEPGCEIRVMEMEIARRSTTSSAGDAVHQLGVLHAGGCAVAVMVSWDPVADHARISQDALDALHDTGIPVYVSCAPLHDKTILVNGTWAGDTSNRYHVLAGSHNLSEPAAHSNDELLFMLNRDPTPYNAYLQHFNGAWNTAGNHYLNLHSISSPPC
ncbi:MAG TPA: phospholipase D-like domain-containing protein [Thermoleophilaceae bacterium]|nr:phospholipase D-like domain-containing protein [Thermoleophilaceae bacterium]